MSVSPDLVALLAHCKHEPTEDDPRLILADWLMDAGQDDRAEFIRLQLLPDPVEDHWEPGSAERVARKRRLLRKHSRKWFGLDWTSIDWCRFPHVPEPEDPDHGDPGGGIKPQRGFLEMHEEAEEIRDRLAAVPEDALPWVEALDHLGGDPETVADLLADPVIDRFSKVGVDTDGVPVRAVTEWLSRGHVRSLWLVADDAGADLLTAMSRLTGPRLRHLELGVELPDSLAGWERFVHAPMLTDLRSLVCRLPAGDDALTQMAGSATVTDLRELYLYGDGFGDAGLIDLFDAGFLAGLRKLTVSNWSRPGSPGVARALAGSMTLRKLEELDLSTGDSRIDGDSLRALARSPVLETVRSLQFCGESIDREGLEALVKSPLLANLERLYVRAPGAADGLPRAIAESPHLSGLRSVELISARPTEDDIRAFASAAHLGTLQNLDLSMGQSSDHLVLQIAGAKSLANLRKLDLHQTPLEPTTWRELGRSDVTRGLVRLDVQNSGFGPEQARELAAAPLAGLRELALYNNPLGDAGLRELAGAGWLPGLIDLNLHGNQIGDAGLAGLLNALTGTRLAQLDLGENRLTDAGAATLLKWPGLFHLIELTTRGNGISPELDRELQRVVRQGPGV